MGKKCSITPYFDFPLASHYQHYIIILGRNNKLV